jgi:hypothetical protein
MISKDHIAVVVHGEVVKKINRGEMAMAKKHILQIETVSVRLVGDKLCLKKLGIVREFDFEEEFPLEESDAEESEKDFPTDESEAPIGPFLGQNIDLFFSFLSANYWPLLYNLAYRTLGNHHNAEDVVQESLMKAYMNLKNRSQEHIFTLKVRSWLCKIVSNTAFTYRDREKRLIPLDLSESSKFLEVEDNTFEQPEVIVIRDELISAVY